MGAVGEKLLRLEKGLMEWLLGLDECHWDACARGDHLGLCSATSSLSSSSRFPSSWRKRMKSLTLMRAGMGAEKNMKTAARAAVINHPAGSRRREQPNSSYCLIFPIRFQRRGKLKKKVLLIARAVLAFGAAGRDSLINQAACFYLLTCSPTLTLFLISPIRRDAA